MPAENFGDDDNPLYVSAEDGDDSNDGRTPQTALATWREVVRRFQTPASVSLPPMGWATFPPTKPRVETKPVRGPSIWERLRKREL